MAEAQDNGPREPGLSPARTVLVVARDSAAGGEIVAALQRRGFPALQGSTAPEALYWARREPPALSILDARVEKWRPLARELRHEGRVVVVLTDDARDREAALQEACLDDALSRLDPEDLARRISVLLRQGLEADGPRVAAGPMVVDLASDRVIWKGRPVPASRLLLRLAAYLTSHAGEVIPTRVLLEQVWGEPWADGSKVHQAMMRLRRLIGEPADSDVLVGRQRHGYCLLPRTHMRPDPLREVRLPSGA
ncbi:MAG: response regulator transcription factor [Actinomycetota bacterium]